MGGSKLYVCKVFNAELILSISCPLAIFLEKRKQTKAIFGELRASMQCQINVEAPKDIRATRSSNALKAGALWRNMAGKWSTCGSGASTSFGTKKSGQLSIFNR